MAHDDATSASPTPMAVNMSSIITNTSAMTALDTLRGINTSLDDQMSRVSTGLRVATAADDAAYWSISTIMKSDTKAMATANESIGLATAVVDTAYAAMETVYDSFVEIRNLAIIAGQLPVPSFDSLSNGGFSKDKTYLQSEVAQLEGQMQQLLNQARGAIVSASFSGTNLLYYPKGQEGKASETVYSFVTGYSSGTVSTIDVNAMNLLLINDTDGPALVTNPADFNPEKALFDIGDPIVAPGSYTPTNIYWFNFPAGGTDVVEVNPAYPLMKIELSIAKYGGNRQGLYSSFVSLIDEKLAGMTSRMSYLGSIRNALDGHETANRKLMDAMTRGVSTLVDADMEEESAKLGAMQARQKLAVQALQIANSQPKAILSLFQ